MARRARPIQRRTKNAGSAYITANAVSTPTPVTASQKKPQPRGASQKESAGRRDRVISSLAKYGIAYADDEPTEALTTKLAQFYADRTLLKRPITPADQAEAIFLLLSNRLRQTTGQMLTVDGGLQEAFLR